MISVSSIDLFHGLMHQVMQVRTLPEEVEGMAEGEEGAGVGGAVTVSTRRAGQEVLAKKILTLSIALAPSK